MEVGEALRRRRMIRRFSGDPIPAEQADRIAAAVLRSPTAGNARGISVVSVTDRSTVADIARACGEPDHLDRGFDPWLSTSAQILVLCVDPGRYRDRYAEPDKDPAVVEAIPWWWVDAGAALMALLTVAVAEGLGAGFLGGHRAGALHALLGIPEDVLIVGLVTVGHPIPDRASSSAQRAVPPGVVRRDRW